MLHEKYRPQDWSEVAGQDKAVATLSRMDKAGTLAGRSYWISGRSGNGKTTLARIIARKVSTPALTMEIDAGELTAGTLREIQNKLDGAIAMAECPLFADGFKPNGGKVLAVIVNEAHGLMRNSSRVMLKLTEAPYADHAVFVFTTTLAGQMQFEDGGIDAGPLLSRCMRIELAQRDVAEPMARRAREIAQAAGLDGQPLEKYVKALRDRGSNMRELLNDIEAGLMAV